MILMLLVSFNFILKETFSSKIAVLIKAGIAAVFTAFIWHYAIEQTTSQIDGWLSNPKLMLDTAVLLSLEIIMQIAFCLMSVSVLTSTDIKINRNRKGYLFKIRKGIYEFLRLFPGVLIFFVLYSLLVTLIFSLPGVDFKIIAYTMAAFIFILIPIGVYGLKWLLPENEIRLELLFMGNIIVAILGIIGTVNGTTSSQGVDEVDWLATILTIGSFIGGALIGTFIYFIKRKFKILQTS